MNSNKRDGNFAYLRRNVLKTRTPGLYPAKDFHVASPDFSLISGAENWVIVDIVGTSDNVNSNLDKYKVIVDTGTGYKFYELNRGETERNSMYTAGNIEAVVAGDDGVYFVGAETGDDKVYRLNTSNTNVTEVGEFDGNALAQTGVFDGLYYWWIGSRMWRQLPGDNPEEIMADTGFGASSVAKVDFFQESLVIFAMNRRRRSVTVFFHDKSDATVFEKRVTIKNARLIAGGVVEGSLMCVYSVGNSANRKEYEGEIVIAKYDGEKFVRVNSIRAGTSATFAPWDGTGNSYGTSMDTGAEIMLFSVSDNINTHSPELAQNYVYKVRSDGSIEVQALPIANGNQTSALIVRATYNYNTYAVQSNPSASLPPVIYSNNDTNDDYDDYRNYTTTEYITNFMQNPYNYHTLSVLEIAFEKLFKNNEASNIPPVPGNSGTLFASEITHESFTLDWTKAVDPTTPQEELQYRVYLSSTNNIDTVENMELNGLLAQDWTTDIDTFDFDELTPETTYWVNVMVRDSSGIAAAYTQIQVDTIEELIITEWRSPASYGDVTLAGSPQDPWTNPGNALAGDGTFATSENSKWNVYYNYGFSIPVGATIRGFEVRVRGYKGGENTMFDEVMTVTATKVAANPTAFDNANGSRSTPDLTLSNASYIIGGAYVLWDTTWTPAEINANAFGTIVRGATQATPNPVLYYLDHIEVRVYYKAP